VIRVSPLAGIRDAVLRRTGIGRVLGPGERLPAWDALSLYTTEAAFAVHREQEIGTLEPGKLADFVVLDRNPMDVAPEQIADIGVLAPIVGGRPAYQSAAILPEA
jgi:predicted amidohydrolase YtcJ